MCTGCAFVSCKFGACKEIYPLVILLGQISLFHLKKAQLLLGNGSFSTKCHIDIYRYISNINIVTC